MTLRSLWSFAIHEFQLLGRIERPLLLWIMGSQLHVSLGSWKFSRLISQNQSQPREVIPVPSQAHLYYIPVQKAEPLRCLALSTRTGRFKSSLSHGYFKSIQLNVNTMALWNWIRSVIVYFQLGATPCRTEIDHCRSCLELTFLVPAGPRCFEPASTGEEEMWRCWQTAKWSLWWD